MNEPRAEGVSRVAPEDADELLPIRRDALAETDRRFEIADGHAGAERAGAVGVAPALELAGAPLDPDAVGPAPTWSPPPIDPAMPVAFAPALAAVEVPTSTLLAAATLAAATLVAATLVAADIAAAASAVELSALDVAAVPLPAADLALRRDFLVLTGLRQRFASARSRRRSTHMGRATQLS